MKKFRIAIPSFPGSNGEVDNVRTLKRCGFDPMVFRWNDSIEKLHEVDGYFFGAGFSYEDRGRSGMVAARDPLFGFIRSEARRGKVVIGNCNGAQVLVESGLLPLGDTLRMCLAHNAIQKNGAVVSPGFLNEWVWMKRSCAPDRCALSDISSPLHIPIAHGEGRFVTRDPDLIQELQKCDQIAFQYCDQFGTVDETAPVTPNGSTMAIAGICNSAGNVVCMMPHPERTENGDPCFHSMRSWMEKHRPKAGDVPFTLQESQPAPALMERRIMPVEIFIGTLITNNEERTVEAAARRVVPSLQLRQFRYVGLPNETSLAALLGSLSFFNPNKEVAYLRVHGQMKKWNADRRATEPLDRSIFAGLTLLRRDQPDTIAASIRGGAEAGVCYDCQKIDASDLHEQKLLDVFSNPHASTLELFSRT